MNDRPTVITVTESELLARVKQLRAQHTAVSRLPRLDEIERELDDAYFLLGDCPHEYDDDWPFHLEEVRQHAPGSKAGDPCVWCPKEKP